MNTNLNLPYYIGQEFYILTKRRIAYECYQRGAIRKRFIYEHKWFVAKRYLKEISIDEEGLIWTFSKNPNLKDDDHNDEDHHYEWFYDKEIYLFTNEIEAENYAISINTMEKLTEE